MKVERYKFIEGSQSAHCCFGYTVVDTKRPVIIHGEHYDNEFHAVCECYLRNDAQLIVASLNGSPPQ